MKNMRYTPIKGCKGCQSLIFFSNKECKFTDSGIFDIPNCPCKVCLVKVTCTIVCSDFLTCAMKYKDSLDIVYFLKSGMKKWN